MRSPVGGQDNNSNGFFMSKILALGDTIACLALQKVTLTGAGGFTFLRRVEQ